MESCEIQNQIDIVAAGPHPRCKDHSYHQSAIQSGRYSVSQLSHAIFNKMAFAKKQISCLPQASLAQYHERPTHHQKVLCLDMRFLEHIQKRS